MEFPNPIPQYKSALEILSRALAFGIEPSLDGVRTLCAQLQNPQERFASLQVAGTNGKSSTVRFLAAILQAHGKRTGLYTSPELVEYRERMEVEGTVSSYEQFGQAILDTHAATLREREHDPAFNPTEFEILTAAALHLFAQERLDTAVLEVGLGGRWDATSVVTPALSVVTGIGFDHMGILGNTLEEIAGEKAAIIRGGAPVILGTKTAVTPQVEQVFFDACARVGEVHVLVREKGAAAHARPEPHALVTFEVTKTPAFIGGSLALTVTTPHARYELSRVAPHYQAQNIACAVAAAEAYLQGPLDPARLQRAVAACPTPGRFDVLRANPLLLIDAAHNPQSVRAFMQAIREMEPDPKARPALLLAVLADKDAAGIVQEVCGEFPHYVITQTTSPRALPAAELAHLVQKATGSMPETYPTVKEALAAYDARPLVCCGSITLAGEVAYHAR